MLHNNSARAQSNRRALLSGTPAVAVLLLSPAAAYAQDAAQAEAAVAEEELPTDIVVSGFRASLGNAQDLKRDADTVVDVISAEDIGALPDRSVAEALQRVPGVNISRFEQRNDPDRFSVEGSGVIIRGLPYVRSELNGRDIFSANGGRELSFNDVSPELLGRVEVYKNSTADMVDGGISGLVNLVTRKPLDSDGLTIAGTIEGNYGDMAKSWSPGFSALIANKWDTPIGSFGLQFGYAQQELVTKTDASQITDPCYRSNTLTTGCIRIRQVGSGGYSGGSNFNESNFPPANTVVVPKGAGVRTTDLERDRNAYSGVLQWESNDGRAMVTVEYLRAETQASINEYSALALVNDDALFPVPVGTWTFDDNNIFQTGTLTQGLGGGTRGIPTELLRFQRKDKAKTEDFSIDIDLVPSDNLRINLEVQHIKSDRTETGFIAAMQTYSDLYIDNTGNTPIVQFLQPGTATSSDAYFTDPTRSLYWFLIDNQVSNKGDLTSMRADIDYDISDDGFFKKARFGARWGERNRLTRSANFSNWGNLGATWTGRNGCWSSNDPDNPDGCIYPPGAFGAGGAYASDFAYDNVRSPFGEGFQRGSVPIPIGNGSAIFFGGDDMVADYLNGDIRTQAGQITAFTLTPNAWFPISARSGNVAGGPWLPGEISDVDESTAAFYGRLDYGTEFGNGWKLDGNIGVRYVKTTVQSGGQVNFPFGGFFDTNSDGTVTVGELQAACGRVVAGQQAPGYCSLTPARQAEFAAVFTGEVINDSANIHFANWLPSFNAKLDFGGGLLLRFAASKGISRPDLSAFATGGAISDNTNDLLQAGTLATGPLFQISTGNRLLTPIEAWNYDVSLEYYFADVGSVSLALFQKDFKNLFGSGQSLRTFTSPSGVTTDVEVNGPVNFGKARLRGVEASYIHAWDFLPGLLSGLGTQLTYTYVDSKDFGSSGDVFGDLPQPGVSKHTINAVMFYEKGPFATRVAYNWRSDYLQTPRDVIFPFSPIYGEATGQLDASVFFSITDQIKIGAQGVNLLDEVTRTSQVIDFDGNRITRSSFRNDRRFTFLLRFDF